MSSCRRSGRACAIVGASSADTTANGLPSCSPYRNGSMTPAGISWRSSGERMVSASISTSMRVNWNRVAPDSSRTRVDPCVRGERCSRGGEPNSLSAGLSFPTPLAGRGDRVGCGGPVRARDRRATPRGRARQERHHATGEAGPVAPLGTGCVRRRAHRALPGGALACRRVHRRSRRGAEPLRVREALRGLPLSRLPHRRRRPDTASTDDERALTSVRAPGPARRDRLQGDPGDDDPTPPGRSLRRGHQVGARQCHSRGRVP